MKIDFFTVNFNEELSALYGGVLHEQVNFTKEAIKKVVSLYKGKYNPSLVLIGHSMVSVVLTCAFRRCSLIQMNSCNISIVGWNSCQSSRG